MSDLETWVRRSLAERADTVDPERARRVALAARPKPRRRRGPWALSAVVVALVAFLAVPLLRTSTPPPTAVGPGPHPPASASVAALTTNAERRARALDLSVQLVRRIPTYPGASSVVQGRSPLRVMSVQVGAGSDQVRLTQLRYVPGRTVREVRAWFDRHVVPGFRPDGPVWSAARQGSTLVHFQTFSAATSPGSVVSGSYDVFLLGGAHGVHVRVDARAAWTPVRANASYVHDVRSVSLTFLRVDGDGHFRSTTLALRGSQAASLVASYNALRAAPDASRARCPMMTRYYLVAFHEPDRTVTVSSAGCLGLGVSVDGRLLSPDLDPGDRFPALVAGLEPPAR